MLPCPFPLLLIVRHLSPSVPWVLYYSGVNHAPPTMATATAPAMQEHRAAVYGVPGRMMRKIVWDSAPGLFASQTWISEPRKIDRFGTDGQLTVKLSFQDNPGNGHNAFHATGTVVTAESKRRKDIAAGGMLHEEIAALFPEIAHLLKWHGTSTDGPCHYIANAIFLAGDRDCYGLRVGEPMAFAQCVRFGDNPIKHRIKSPSFVRYLQNCAPDFDCEVLQYDHKDRETYGPKFTYGGYASAWHECPFDTKQEALDFLYALQNCSPNFLRIPTIFSNGKERELDSARRVAVWPDATDAELSVETEQLKIALMARLPKLLEDFKSDILAAGFLWELP